MEGYLRQGDITVLSNLPLYQIKELSIEETIGRHVTADITAITDYDEWKTTETEVTGEPVKICVRKDGKEILLFYGVISQLCLTGEAEYTTLHMRAYSLSWFMDLEKKNRSFQNAETTIAGLLQQVTDENSFMIRNSAEDKKMEAPFIQYQETDWEFLIRISSHLGAPVIPAGNYEGKGIYIGFPKGMDKVELETDQEIWCLDSEEKNYGANRTIDATYYQVLSAQICHLGGVVKYQNEELMIHHVHMYLAQGILCCSYRLAGRGYRPVSVSYGSQKGVSVTGNVLERKEELVKLHLDMDESQNPDQAYFYPWMPQHGNISYCMPEVGSKVRLLIPDGDEQKAVATECVQTGTESMEVQNPENRWLITPSGKKMAMYPGYFELSASSDQSSIKLQDGAGPIFDSKKEILIQADGDLTLYGADITLLAPKEISAVRRDAGSPAVINLCHNLDVLGQYSTFKNLDELKKPLPVQSGVVHQSSSGQSKAEIQKQEEKEREKLEFQLKKLLAEEEKCTFEVGSAITKIIAAIPQTIEEEELSQISIGFRPIAGKMKGE